MDFIELARKMKHVDNTRILAFDPGHTTGFAVFEDQKILDCGEIDTTDMENAVLNVTDIFEPWKPDVVVIEDYRIYKWRAKHHVGSPMLTTRVIGCIETIAIQRGIYKIYKQPAHIAKGFCTDPKLKDWGFFLKGKKHANDAIRHGAYYLLFGPIQSKDRKGRSAG